MAWKKPLERFVFPVYKVLRKPQFIWDSLGFEALSVQNGGSAQLEKREIKE